MGGKGGKVSLVVMLHGVAVTCTKESMVIRDGVGKGAMQPAHFLIFKPGTGRRKVELLHEHLSAVSGLGVLLRKVETGIRGISHVIVDEIHERDINVS